MHATTDLWDLSKGETLSRDTGIPCHTALALDETGVPNAAYHDSVHTALRYGFFREATWFHSQADDLDNVGRWPSLVMRDGTVHIGYRDETNDARLYTQFNDIGWVSENQMLRAAHILH